MMEEMIGKKVLCERNLPNSQNPFIYVGIILEVNDDGIWLDDRKYGKMFLPFSQITIKEVKE